MTSTAIPGVACLQTCPLPFYAVELGTITGGLVCYSMTNKIKMKMVKKIALLKLFIYTLWFIEKTQRGMKIFMLKSFGPYSYYSTMLFG